MTRSKIKPIRISENIAYQVGFRPSTQKVFEYKKEGEVWMSGTEIANGMLTVDRLKIDEPKACDLLDKLEELSNADRLLKGFSAKGRYDVVFYKNGGLPSILGLEIPDGFLTENQMIHLDLIKSTNRVDVYTFKESLEVEKHKLLQDVFNYHLKEILA